MNLIAVKNIHTHLFSSFVRASIMERTIDSFYLCVFSFSLSLPTRILIVIITVVTVITVITLFIVLVIAIVLAMRLDGDACRCEQGM